MKKIILLIFFTIFLFNKNLYSKDEAPFILNADKIINNNDKSLIIAEGNVEIIQGNEVLRADFLKFDRIKNKAFAKGNVSILDKDGVVYFADYAEVDKGFKNGLTKNISILFPDNSKMAASKGKRFKGQISRLKNALYSACDCDDPNKKPTWQIKASEVVHDSQRKKISYKNAFMEFLGFPVAYTPYYSHPDPSVKRQSGFLFPKYTSNSELGTIVGTPYYFAISPYKDLTIEPMYIGNQKPLILANYRQRFTNGEINIDTSFTNGDRRTRSRTYSNKYRGHFFINGNFDHNEFWRYGFNLKRSTDDTYLSRYLLEGATDRLHSDFFIEGFDNRNYFHATGIATQVQSSTYQSSKTPLVLPSINYNYQGKKTKYGFVDFNANLLSLTRREGADLRKISLQPIITYPFQDNFGNRFKFQMQTTLSSYMVSHVERQNKIDYKGYKTRIHPEIILGWDLPLQKIENNRSYFLKPQAALILAPNRGTQDEIPNEDSDSFEFGDTHLFNASLYPGTDKLEKSNQRIDYGLNFGIKSQDKELRSDFFIGQSYRFRENNNFGLKSGLNDKVSDLIGKIGFGFGKNIDFSYRFLMNKDDLFSTRRDQFGISVGFKNSKVKVNYVFLEPTTGISDEREELNFAFLHDFNESYSLKYSLKSDLTDTGGLLGQKLAFSFDNECFTTEIGLNRSYYLDREIKPNDTFLITFTFKTLGTFATGRNISN
tara:strand:+ start:3330 stop:5474 length:2145 start_codon:yes stop_codon:yes gene_type:complete